MSTLEAAGHALRWIGFMDRRTQPVSYVPRWLSAFFSIAILVHATTAAAEDVSWEPLGIGLAATIWKPDTRCPDTDRLLAIKVDPEQYRFTIHNYVQEGLRHPLTIEEWQQRTGHDVLVNAGLFRENFAYLGLLFKGGQSLASRRHNAWQGLFVAEPQAPTTHPKAGVLDLSTDIFHEETPAYREAAQSLMLLDRTGAIRVRQTGKRAYQTVVAEDTDGHILILKTLSPVTLHGLGQCLRDTFPSIKLAMAMDGGSSSDLVVSDKLWRYTVPSEARAHWKDLFAGQSTAHIPLPTIIGVSPRESVTSTANPSSKP